MCFKISTLNQNKNVGSEVKMFFARPGTYMPCGMFNFKHLILFIATITGVTIASKHTNIKDKSNVKKIIKKLTCVLWILEIFKIGFDFVVGDGKNLNKVVPLYYCSLLLYAGIFSSIGKGFIKKMGDVFLATGAFIGGLVFIIFPTTSLPEYPMFHFITLHSFLFHGIMIYLSIIVNKSKYIELKMSDIKYYASLIFIICVGAFIVNSKYGCNLMFISQDFPGTPISGLYKFFGRYFTLFMCLIQMTLPFFISYLIVGRKKKEEEREMLLQEY